MPTQHWPPPGFPLVHGSYALTEDWSIELPQRFARRVEDGAMVLWRPGLTVWLKAWNNARRESHAGRLDWIREAASPDRFAEVQATGGGVTRWSYRLRDENDDGPVESVYGYVIGDEGHLQLAVYYDDIADEAKAMQLVYSVADRRLA